MTTCCGAQNFEIRRGVTFAPVLRWGQDKLIYKTISAATQAAPCMLTVTAHGLPEQWPAWIKGISGMEELNTVLDENGKPTAYYFPYVEDVNTLELNSIDSTDFDALTGSGVLIYNEPVDLTGYTATMVFYDQDDFDTALLTLSSPAGVVLDTSAKTITPTITAAATAALTWDTAVYRLILTAPDTTKVLVAEGTVTVKD